MINVNIFHLHQHKIKFCRGFSNSTRFLSKTPFMHLKGTENHSVQNFSEIIDLTKTDRGTKRPYIPWNLSTGQKKSAIYLTAAYHSKRSVVFHFSSESHFHTKSLPDAITYGMFRYDPWHIRNFLYFGFCYYKKKYIELGWLYGRRAYLKHMRRAAISYSV